jgi:hypothetical protein
LLNSSKLILSLCDYSGRWPSFYTPDEGYEVLCLDLKSTGDIRTLQFLNREVHGILAAPPCTDFSVSGAQYWPDKDGDGRTLTSLSIVDACLRAVAIYRPKWWVLENPVGRLRRYLGPPKHSFNPWEYAGYGSDADRYTKKTLLWGDFVPPIESPLSPLASGNDTWIMKLGGKSEKTKTLRSMTPLGFAKAFREANP